MSKYYRNILITVLLALAPSLYSEDQLTLSIFNPDFDIKVKMSSDKGLDFGTVKATKKSKKIIYIKNLTDDAVTFNNWRSPCVCLSYYDTPIILQPGKQSKVSAVLDGAGYRGSFSKFMYIGFKNEDGQKGSFFMPVKFTVTETGTVEKVEAIQKQNIEKLQYIDFDFGKSKQMKSLKENGESSAWIFAGKDCPECNYLKRHVLPDLIEAFKQHSDNPTIPLRIITVDLNKKENFLLLLALEEKLHIKNANKTPVLYWNGTLYYGSKAIKEAAKKKTSVSLEKNGLLSELLCKNETNDKDNLVQKRASQITLAAIIIGGLTDGINPCVFTTLIFFVSLLSISGVQGRRLFMVGTVYCLACFISYTLLGLGLFSALKALSAYKWIQQVFNTGLIAVLVVFALLSFRDAFKFSKSGKAKDVALQLPDSMKSKIHSIMRQGLKAKYLLPGAFLIGVFVTLIESVCTGQIYIPVLAIMIQDHNSESLKWLWYLLLYNFMFIVPLIVIFLCVWQETSQSKFLKWSKQNVVFGKIAMGLFFLLLAGIMILFF